MESDSYLLSVIYYLLSVISRPEPASAGSGRVIGVDGDVLVREVGGVDRAGAVAETEVDVDREGALRHHLLHCCKGFRVRHDGAAVEGGYTAV